MRMSSFTKLAAVILLLATACQKERPKQTADADHEYLESADPGISTVAPLGTLIDGAIYCIRGLSSSPACTVVEVTGNSTAEDAKIRQWSWFPNNGQKWELFSFANKATSTKMVVDPENASPGAKIRQKNAVSGTQDLSNFHNVYFQNPLSNASMPDPYVAQKDGYYYFMYTRGNRIGLRKTTSMSLLSTARETVVWTPPAGTAYSSNIWAPEMHFLSGKWYLYFAANDGTDNAHRMYVLENSNADPMTGTWTFKGKIFDSTDQWAIDGSVLTIGSANYFIWSGWENTASRYKQYIYLATMSNPWTISGRRVKISSPTNNWEKHEPNSLGAGVNEGPVMLQKDAGSPAFIIYSASRYSSDNYCLAQLQLKIGGDPTVAADWINKKQVFVRNDVNSVYGPGHNGFFTSSCTDANGVARKENWFIYHARSVPNSTGGARTPRMQKLTWNTDGSPNFGVATATGVDLAVPVGE